MMMFYICSGSIYFWPITPINYTVFGQVHFRVLGIATILDQFDLL